MWKAAEPESIWQSMLMPAEPHARIKNHSDFITSITALAQELMLARPHSLLPAQSASYSHAALFSCALTTIDGLFTMAHKGPKLPINLTKMVILMQQSSGLSSTCGTTMPRMEADHCGCHAELRWQSCCPPYSDISDGSLLHHASLLREPSQ